MHGKNPLGENLGLTELLVNAIASIAIHSQPVGKLAKILGFFLCIELDRHEGEGIDLLIHVIGNSGSESGYIHGPFEVLLEVGDFLFVQIAEASENGLPFRFVDISVCFGGIAHRLNEKLGFILCLLGRGLGSASSEKSPEKFRTVRVSTGSRGTEKIVERISAPAGTGSEKGTEKTADTTRRWPGRCFFPSQKSAEKTTQPPATLLRLGLPATEKAAEQVAGSSPTAASTRSREKRSENVHAASTASAAALGSRRRCQNRPECPKPAGATPLLTSEQSSENVSGSGRTASAAEKRIEDASSGTGAHCVVTEKASENFDCVHG